MSDKERIDSVCLISFPVSMGDGQFRKPVVISPRWGHPRQVRSVAEAGRVLLYEWPQGPNPKCNSAARLVIEALHGRRKPSEVRKALVDAASASGILVEPTVPFPSQEPFPSQSQ